MNITSRKNQHIQLLRSLMRDRTARSENGIFVAEGMKLLSEALSCGFVIKEIFITEKALSKNKDFFNDSLKNTAIITISEDLSGYISDTVSPQGVFFTLPLLDKFLNLDKIVIKEKKCRFIMLDGLQDLGNIGTIIRTADAFGIDGIILSADTGDIHSPKLMRSTAGSVFRLPVYRMDLPNAINCLKDNGFSIYAAMPDENAKRLDGISFNEKSCVIIGNEGNGISLPVSEASDEKILIPIRNAESLNAAVAASIIMYEMSK